MRYLIIADIHGNLPALEAILATSEAKTCDRIISLGDHTGFGPCPRQVHQRLAELDAVMLMGNHDWRLLHASEPQFQTYNWQLLQWTAEQMKSLTISEQIDLRIGDTWLTHAAPGNPLARIEQEDLPEMLAAVPEDIRLLISGHIHRGWQVTLGHQTAINPGAAGMPEDEIGGGRAPFLVLTEENGQCNWELFNAWYDIRQTRRLYAESGCTKVAPEMCRCAYQILEHGNGAYMLRFFEYAHRLAEQQGLKPGSEEAFRAADAVWNWPEPMDSRAYWKKEDPA